MPWRFAICDGVIGSNGHGGEGGLGRNHGLKTEW